ncbi:hypothetical protein [Dickeya dianthicola]|uniref:Uncharacterized protein n=1 Tax=Dickeya dianthicola TaxID=204039 RepID=A0AAX1C1C6_9GAMM|nr:hypothetical protein [Dickeya dianthicola]MBT1427790.1 hypothetical protein [Dickeya dianthicola]MBT1431857.1 hypothetical protein [Dickeya dianthicola]MBT1459303.1 hypothetical protein [Dickeya dianthicola]MBT1488500.1 hypothetical protein [Dickeya dianthicola]MCA7004788.1 hypothetical protein [Dickeya dianthicola]
MGAVNDIQKATQVAIESLRELSEKAKDIIVEEAIFENGNIEVTLSYIDGGIPGYIDSGIPGDITPSAKFLSLLGERRKWRIFLIDKDHKTFKGFKAYHRDRK